MRAWRNLFAVGAGAVLCAGAVLAALWAGYLRLPFVRAPEPTGGWPVGTGILHDGTSPASTVAVWYPAAPGTTGRRAPYLMTARPLRDRLLGALVRTNAVAGAAVAAGRFPVVVYVSGWGGRRENNTALTTDLASHGYVVFALDDVFANVPLDFSSETARRRTVAFAERKVRSEAARVATLLDTLATRENAPNGRFAQRLDLRHVGVLGFSFGGAVAAEAARCDPRVGAAVNLDGWLFGAALAGGVPRPFLTIGTPLLRDGAKARPANEAARVLDRFDRENEALALAGLQRHGGYFVTIAGTDHYNFTDAAWLPSIRHTGVGPIDGRRGERIVAAYVVAFFDRFLKRRGAAAFGGSEPIDSAARLLTFSKPPVR
jgi:predicted dienelactone hydrolase